jgi:hypothetical protein
MFYSWWILRPYIGNAKYFNYACNNYIDYILEERLLNANYLGEYRGLMTRLTIRGDSEGFIKLTNCYLFEHIKGNPIRFRRFFLDVCKYGKPQILLVMFDHDNNLLDEETLQKGFIKVCARQESYGIDLIRIFVQNVPLLNYRAYDDLAWKRACAITPYKTIRYLFELFEFDEKYLKNCSYREKLLEYKRKKLRQRWTKSARN